MPVWADLYPRPASWVFTLHSCAGPCIQKHPMLISILCCCGLEILVIFEQEPLLFILHWAQQSMYWSCLKQSFAQSSSLPWGFSICKHPQGVHFSPVGCKRNIISSLLLMDCLFPKYCWVISTNRLKLSPHAMPCISLSLRILESCQRTTLKNSF